MSLISHGNDASGCQTVRINPATNHTVTSITGFFDEMQVKGMLVRFADKQSTSFGDTTSKNL